jgi:hypothetical protein
MDRRFASVNLCVDQQSSTRGRKSLRTPAEVFWNGHSEINPNPDVPWYSIPMSEKMKKLMLRWARTPRFDKPISGTKR